MTSLKTLRSEPRNREGLTLADARHRDRERCRAREQEERTGQFRTRNGVAALGLVCATVCLATLFAPFAFSKVLATLTGTAGLLCMSGARRLNQRLRERYG